MNIAQRGVAKLRSVAGQAYLGGMEAARSITRAKPAPLVITRVSTQQEFLQHRNRTRDETERLLQLEGTLAKNQASIRTLGFCFVCAKWTHFSSSWAYSYERDGRPQINWREHLVCPHCHLNNRMRAAIHLAEATGSKMDRLNVYATEQVTALFARLKERCRAIVGSEYLGDSVPLGARNAAGIMNQDITRLTFPDDEFDLILSFEVLEHVPDYLRAFEECARTLRPGGKMLFSAPFDPASASNLIRARILPDHSIEHLMPPEYHGDPLNDAGCLCYQTFGWEMLDQVRRAGFSDVWALLYHSMDYGYLGDEQIQFLAVK